MKLETWRFAGPTTTSMSFPRREFAYRLLAVTVYFQWTATIPAQINPQLRIVDGSGLPIMGFGADASIANVGLNGDLLWIVWSAANPSLFTAADVSNTVILPALLAPEVWVPPQSAVQIYLGGMQTGSPPDLWISTAFAIGRR